MHDPAPLNIARAHRCPHCGYRELLGSASLSPHEINGLGEYSTHRRGPYQRGDYIYRAGEEAGCLYVVQSGAVKTQFVTYEGDLRISEFVYSGELFGLDACGETHHPSDAVALERTWVCEIPLPRLEALCHELPWLQHQVFGLFGRRLRRSEQTGLITRNCSAEERVVRFLGDLYRRAAKRLGRIDEIRLPMRKVEIANYLALTPEHLSRILRELEAAGLIRNHFRSIELLDRERFSTARTQHPPPA